MKNRVKGQVFFGLALLTLTILITSEAPALQPAACSNSARNAMVQYTLGEQQNDLQIIHELDGRLQRGEITDSERQRLWDAYLARLSPQACPDREPGGRLLHRSLRTGPMFVGPGF